MTYMQNRRSKLLITGGIIIAVFAWLLISTLRGATTPYTPVGQIIANGPSNALVRAVGNASDIVWDTQTTSLRFVISDEGGSLPVVYRGVRPDLLVDGVRTVVEGRYLAGGTLTANKLLLECPSKYQEE